MCLYLFVLFFKQKTAYEMRISDWSSDVCSSDLEELVVGLRALHLVEQEFHRCDLVHRLQQLAQDPDLLQQLRLDQQVLAAGAGLVAVDARVHTLFGESAVEVDRTEDRRVWQVCVIRGSYRWSRYPSHNKYL